MLGAEASKNETKRSKAKGDFNVAWLSADSVGHSTTQLIALAHLRHRAKLLLSVQSDASFDLRRDRARVLVDRWLLLGHFSLFLFCLGYTLLTRSIGKGMQKQHMTHQNLRLFCQDLIFLARILFFFL